MGCGSSLFGRKEKTGITLSKASSSSNKVGQHGETNIHSEYARPSLQPPNQRSEPFPHSQPRPQTHSKPRTVSLPAPTSANKPWVAIGQNGGITTLSEYAHPSQLSPQQRSQEYPRPQPHPQSHSQPRPSPHPAQRPQQNAARNLIPATAGNYFPSQYPNQSYSVAGSFAHQPAVRGADNNNRGFCSSPPQQRSTQLSMEPLPSLGYVLGSGFYGDSNQGPPSPVTPGASGQRQSQELKSNRTPSPVSPMDKQWPEFPSWNVYAR